MPLPQRTGRLDDEPVHAVEDGGDLSRVVLREEMLAELVHPLGTREQGHRALLLATVR